MLLKYAALKFAEIGNSRLKEISQRRCYGRLKWMALEFVRSVPIYFKGHRIIQARVTLKATPSCCLRYKHNTNWHFVNTQSPVRPSYGRTNPQIPAHGHLSLCHGRGGLGGLNNIRVSNFMSRYSKPLVGLFEQANSEFSFLGGL